MVHKFDWFFPKLFKLMCISGNVVMDVCATHHGWSRAASGAQCPLQPRVILYDGPLMQKSEANLAECFDKFFSTFELSILETITIQLELTWTPLIVKYSNFKNPFHTNPNCGVHSTPPVTVGILLSFGRGINSIYPWLPHCPLCHMIQLIGCGDVTVAL